MVGDVFRSCFSLNVVSWVVHLQGGVDDEVTLSAYITIALLEIPLPTTVRAGNPSAHGHSQAVIIIVRLPRIVWEVEGGCLFL